MRFLTRPEDDLVRSCREHGEFFWLDLVDPDAETLRELGALLRWNPLLVEDLEHGGQRPKVEDFADHTLVITYAARHDAATSDIVLLEHGLVVHGDYLVTVRPGEGGEPLTRLREALAANHEGMPEAAIVHRVLDRVVDSTMEAADIIAADVDHLDDVIANGSTDDVLEALRSCRRDLVNLRGVVVAQRDALASLSAALDSIPGFELGMRSHFRDITDHARRVVDKLDVSRDLLDGAFEAYYTTLVARQGAVTQRLTVISTIFLPLTFVTGFFGQNFAWMVEHVASEQAFLLYGVGTTAVTAVLLTILFVRLRWW